MGNLLLVCLVVVIQSYNDLFVSRRHCAVIEEDSVSTAAIVINEPTMSLL